MSATNESVSHSTAVHHLLVDDDVEMLISALVNWKPRLFGTEGDRQRRGGPSLCGASWRRLI